MPLLGQHVLWRHARDGGAQLYAVAHILYIAYLHGVLGRFDWSAAPDAEPGTMVVHFFRPDGSLYKRVEFTSATGGITACPSVLATTSMAACVPAHTGSGAAVTGWFSEWGGRGASR